MSDFMEIEKRSPKVKLYAKHCKGTFSGAIHIAEIEVKQFEVLQPGKRLVITPNCREILLDKQDIKELIKLLQFYVDNESIPDMV